MSVGEMGQGRHRKKKALECFSEPPFASRGGGGVMERATCESHRAPPPLAHLTMYIPENLG